MEGGMVFQVKYRLLILQTQDNQSKQKENKKT